MDRRKFLYSAGLFSGGLLLASNGLAKRAEAFSEAGNLSHLRAFGYGALSSVAAKNTSETMLALPPGFEYNVIGKVGTPMADGRQTPRSHDGMATFKVGGELRIVRNHEVTNNKVPIASSGIGKNNHYDETAGGGTTTLIINPKTREIVRDFVSLSGTLINCAGGRTPWGSWISCEETTLGPTVRTSATGVKTGGFAKPHGYCFDVSASANETVPPVPLKAMGRFVHEAVSVDKKTGIVYLTEDMSPSAGFYRFLPKRKNHLAEGGTLQMLRVKGQDQYDTRKNQKAGVKLATEWVTIERPDPPEADVDERIVQKEGFGKGAAHFLRLEGCYIDEKGRTYFTSTSGGNNAGGQIWMHAPNGRDEGVLTLLFESPDRDLLDMPDNICLQPKTDRLFICEDSDYVGQGGTAENFVRILTPEGKMADFAKNVTPNFLKCEFAGSTFSRDGKTLFVNLQAVGATLAIWGDWSKFKV